MHKCYTAKDLIFKKEYLSNLKTCSYSDLTTQINIYNNILREVSIGGNVAVLVGPICSDAASVVDSSVVPVVLCFKVCEVSVCMIVAFVLCVTPDEVISAGVDVTCVVSPCEIKLVVSVSGTVMVIVGK